MKISLDNHVCHIHVSYTSNLGMMLTLMNLEILVAQESKLDDGFYSPAKLNQNFDSSTQDDHYKGIGASNNPSAGISNVDDVVDDSTNDHNHGDQLTNGMSFGQQVNKKLNTN